MTDETEGPTDLLGDPWRELPDPRGRKAHVRSPQVAETVALLRAGGQTEDDIALRLNCDPKTLRKYYSRELHDGPKLIDAVLLETQFAEAKKGKASAARFVREVLRKDGDPTPPMPRRRSARKPEPLGKKAQADIDAQSAHKGTAWGDLLAPANPVRPN